MPFPKPGMAHAPGSSACCAGLYRKFTPLTDFSDFALLPPLQRALSAEGYTTPTPIQAQAIPPALVGRDILGIAQTGTGKTCAFALPILQRLGKSGVTRKPRSCRALILSPTRELASQIAESFRTYGKFMHLSIDVVFGGMPIGKQIRRLSTGADILVATPGRLCLLYTSPSPRDH
jgi:ATP-dependent RNA helicase RhlE